MQENDGKEVGSEVASERRGNEAEKGDPGHF
jgi:hypothetical protein